jgi:transposase
MAYSLDLRTRVVAAVRSGMKKSAASQLYKVCQQTIGHWFRLEKEQGHLNPKTGYQKGHSHGIKDFEVFRCYVDTHSDYTQEEMAVHFSVGSSTIGRALKKIGYSRKKRIKLIRSATKNYGKNMKKK